MNVATTYSVPVETTIAEYLVQDSPASTPNPCQSVTINT
jgi:hypothetical protein